MRAWQFDQATELLDGRRSRPRRSRRGHRRRRRPPAWPSRARSRPRSRATAASRRRRRRRTRSSQTIARLRQAAAARPADPGRRRARSGCGARRPRSTSQPRGGAFAAGDLRGSVERERPRVRPPGTAPPTPGRNRVMSILAATIAALVAVAFIVSGVRGVAAATGRDADRRRRHARTRAASRRELRAAAPRPIGATWDRRRGTSAVARTAAVRGAGGLAVGAATVSRRPSRPPALATSPGRGRPSRPPRTALSLVSTATYTLVPDKAPRPRHGRRHREEQQAEPRPRDAERHDHDPLLLRVGDDRRPRRGDRDPGDAGGKRRLATKVTPDDGFARARRRLPGRPLLRPDDEVHGHYDLPGGAPRSESDIRVGSAFATFYAWAFGDSGDVRIVVPAGFEVETTGSPTTKSIVDGVTRSSRRRASPMSTDWYVDRRRRPPRRPDPGPDRPRRRRAPRRSGPGPRTPEWQTRVGDLLRDRACRSWSRSSASTGRSTGDIEVDRGPHAAARGLRRRLPPRRGPDRDQRGPRRADDPPRGVARLVQREPVRRALDRRGPRRRVRLAGPRRGLERRPRARPGLAADAEARSGSTSGRHPGRIADEATGHARRTATRRRGPPSGRSSTRPARRRCGRSSRRRARHETAYVGAGAPETVGDAERLAPLPRPARGARRARRRPTRSSGAGS